MNLNCITGNQDHLYKHLQQSIHNAKSIDIIVSFLMESGVKLIQEDLKELKERNIPIRILTGNYLNITQPSALYLIKDILGDNLDLRFYSDTKRSFHAKAYIFEYTDTGEIYIGSSNLSRSAWTSAIEWNYRIDKKQNEEDYMYFKNMFEDLFNNESIIVNDQELEKYSKSWKKPKLNLSIENKKEELNYTYDDPKVSELFEPRGAQIEALYELKKTREEGNDKGLVVAATGIGKTYLAAFDSRKYEKVLFVAHREEILKQAYDSFKNIRKDKIIKAKVNNNEYLSNVAENASEYLDDIGLHNNIQEEYNMGFFMNSTKDTDKDIIFASVQSLGKNEYLSEEYFPKDYFDYVVVDEFHHAVSKNYQNIINYFEPKFMLGITATPDRLDNKDVFSICDYNTVYEVTLKNAIDKGWLVPFRYYGIYDNSVDYSDIEFKNGKYNEKELESALSINNRAELILNHYKKYKSRRALGFCTSKSHAEFMAKYFNENGIKACAVYSGNEGEYNEDRNIALKKLRDEELQVIFSVDMFNEGLDVKSIDMVLFLRPTESPTVFLQQLGRGLRKDKSKKYLNVLDFIGNYKKANLVPFLLSGEAKGKVAERSTIPKEEDYPEDCFIDFDFRLIDIFERMQRANMKLQELIDEEYLRIKEYLGYRPSRTDILTYMDNNIYASMRNKNNILEDYLGYLDSINELSEEEKELKDSKVGLFLNMIATTKMNKFYKIPILLTIYNKGNISTKVSNEECDITFKEFCINGSNKSQIIKGEKFSGIKELNEKLNEKKFINNARRQPINAFLKSSSEFFYLDNDYLCLDDSLSEYVSSELFKKEFKDCIDYRLKRFYKETHS